MNSIQYSHPRSSPQYPTPPWQTSRHLRVNKTVGLFVVRQTELQLTEVWKEAHQEQIQTWMGNLFPLLQSTPTLKVKKKNFRYYNNATQ